MVTLSIASLIGLLVVVPIGLSVFAYKFERKILDEIEEKPNNNVNVIGYNEIITK